jgi:AcrR family transcriptional regulator
MCDKRLQGRPARGGNEVGSERIIESVREMLRSRSFESMSRKNLAEHAGVTPALITYYFPSKDGLIEEATKPIVENYARRLGEILRADDKPDSKLRSIISLLVSCYAQDGGIFDAYSELVRKNGRSSKPNYIDLMAQELSNFFCQWFKKGSVSDPHPVMLQGALWGMCQFAAQTELFSESFIRDAATDLPAEFDRVTPIYLLITRGLDHWRRRCALTAA